MAARKVSLRSVQVPNQTLGSEGDLSFLPDQTPANEMNRGLGTSDDLGFDLPDQKPKTSNVYDSVSKFDPQRSAEVVQLSRRLSEPEAFIDKNLDNVKKAANAPSPSFFTELEAQYPGTTKFLSNPSNMIATHDDLPNVANHEKLTTAAAATTGYWQDFESGLQGSSLGLFARNKLPDLALPENAGVLDSLAAQAGMLLGDLPAMAAGTVGGTAAAGPLGGTVAAFATPAMIKKALVEQYKSGNVQTYGDFFERMGGILKEGAKQGIVGLVTGTVGQNLKVLNALGSPLTQKLTGVIPQLLAEDVAMTSTGKAVEGERASPRDYAEGLLTLGAMHGTSHGVEMLGERAGQMRAENKTQQMRDFYTALGNTAEASKLRTRLPEAYQEMVAGLTKDSPIENIFIPVQDVETYFQGKNIDTGKATDEIGVRGSYEEAKATGGDVQIPLANWVSKVVGTEHYQGLVDDIKFSPDDLTARQAQARKTETESQIKEADAQAQATSTESTPEDSAKQISADLEEQLKAAGLTAAEAKLNPKIHEAFFRTMGEKLGVDPYELSKRFPLEIGRSADAPGKDAKALNQSQVNKEHSDLLAKIDTAEKAAALKGEERAQYLKALDEVYGSKEDRAKSMGFGKKVWFHGTGADISAFDPELLRTNATGPSGSVGFHFAKNVELANQYADHVTPTSFRKAFAVSNKAIDAIGNFRQAMRDKYGSKFEDQWTPKENAKDKSLHEKFFKVQENLNAEEAKFKEMSHASGNEGGNNVVPVRLKTKNGVGLELDGGQIGHDEAAQAKSLKDEGRYNAVVFKNAYDNLSSSDQKVGSSDVALMFHEKDIRSINAAFDPRFSESPLILSQGESGAARGRIRITNDRKFSIDLLEKADKSTFFHETGHFFLEVLGDIANQKSAPEHISRDYQTLLDWFGVKSRDEITPEHHEKFARGFESYLMEGKAPTEKLARAFSKFKDWLVNIYGQLRSLDVNLTPEVRAVMDRMLASESEIKRAREAVGYTGQDIPGLTPEVQAKIHDMQIQARSIAESSLLREQMAELDKKHEQFLATERARLTDIAKKEVSEQPLFSAINALKEIPGAKRDQAEFAKKFLSGKLKDKEAAHMEMLAELHYSGAELRPFADGDELARQIIEAEKTGQFDKEVLARVEAGMAQHADIRNTDKIREEAMKAIHGEKMTELLALEREALHGLVENSLVRQEVSKRKRLEARVEAEAAKDQAREILSNKPIKEAAKSSIYVTAERNAAIKVSKALGNKDYAAAVEAKRQQMLNHALAAEAMRNKAEVEKTLDYLSKFDGRDDLMKMPFAFVRQIDSLLSGVGLARPRAEDATSLIKIAQDMFQKGEDPGEIANLTGQVQDKNGQWGPEKLPDFISRVNDNYYAFSVDQSVLSLSGKSVQDLNLQEMRDLKSAVKGIAEIGKRYNKFLGEFNTLEIRAEAARFKARVEETVGTPMAENLAPGEKILTPIGKMVDALSNVSGAIDRWLDNILTITNKLDGLKEGPAKDHIYRPIKEAEDRKMARLDVAMKELDQIFAKHYEPKEFAKYKDTKFAIDGRNFSKEEILSMALNWGNAGNKDRLMKGFGFDQSKMDFIFSHLDKKDWDFAQGVWDHLHTFWPEIVKLEMDVAGSDAKGVEPVAFTNQHGSYAGGYYPIAYDFDKSADAYKTNIEKSELYKQMSVAKAQTSQGHTEARVSSVTRPLRLSLDVLKGHYEDIIHDLEFRRAVIDVNRFLNQRDSKAAITNAIGVRGYAAIGDWLKAAASAPSEPISFGDQASRWFRFKTTFFNLGYRLVSTPKIALENAVNVASEVGISGAARAVKGYYLDGNVTHDMVTEKSEFMNQRATHLNRDFADINEWRGNDKAAFQKYGFAIHAIIDSGFSFPLWADVYQRAIAEHGDEKLAVNQADESVKSTFMSGGRTDQPAIMRGSEKQKLVTMAYSYQSMMWQRFSESRFQAGMEWAQGNKAAAVAVAARATVYQFIAPAIIAALTREFLRNNKTTNEDDRKKRMIGTVIDEATPLKFVPIVRDFVPYLVKKSLGEQTRDIQTTPLEGAAETILNAAGGAIHGVGSGQFSKNFTEDTTNAISLLVGVPKQVDDVVFNFLDWQAHNGELTWRDFISHRTKK